MTKKVENLSIFDKGMILEGTVTCGDKLVIKGKFKGTLKGENVLIGEEGSVFGELAAKHITIGGYFEGTLQSWDALHILASGTCEGKVSCKNLLVEPGGILNAGVTYLANPSPMVETQKTQTNTDVKDKKQKPNKQ